MLVKFKLINDAASLRVTPICRDCSGIEKWEGQLDQVVECYIAPIGIKHEHNWQSALYNLQLAVKIADWRTSLYPLVTNLLPLCPLPLSAIHSTVIESTFVIVSRQIQYKLLFFWFENICGSWLSVSHAAVHSPWTQFLHCFCFSGDKYNTNCSYLDQRTVEYMLWWWLFAPPCNIDLLNARISFNEAASLQVYTKHRGSCFPHPRSSFPKTAAVQHQHIGVSQTAARLPRISIEHAGAVLWIFHLDSLNMLVLTLWAFVHLLKHIGVF